jgi:hypothetical protein
LVPGLTTGQFQDAGKALAVLGYASELIRILNSLEDGRFLEGLSTLHRLDILPIKRTGSYDDLRESCNRLFGLSSRYQGSQHLQIMRLLSTLRKIHGCEYASRPDLHEACNRLFGAMPSLSDQEFFEAVRILAQLRYLDPTLSNDDERMEDDIVDALDPDSVRRLLSSRSAAGSLFPWLDGISARIPKGTASRISSMRGHLSAAGRREGIAVSEHLDRAERILRKRRDARRAEARKMFENLERSQRGYLLGDSNWAERDYTRSRRREDSGSDESYHDFW